MLTRPGQNTDVPTEVDSSSDAQRFHDADGRDLRRRVDARIHARQKAAHRRSRDEVAAFAMLQHVRRDTRATLL